MRATQNLVKLRNGTWIDISRIISAEKQPGLDKYILDLETTSENLKVVVGKKDWYTILTKIEYKETDENSRNL